MATPARKGLFPFLFRRPAPEPLAALKTQLRALGAVEQEGLAQPSAEPTVLAKIDGGGVADAELLAVAVSVTAEAEGTHIQLRGRDGAVIDAFTAAVGEEEAVLFMPPVPAVLVARTPQGRPAKGTSVNSRAVFAFTNGTATPAKLAVVTDLTRPFDWSGAYLPPKPGDVGGRLRAGMFKEMTTAHAIPTVGGLQVLLEPADELSRAVFVTGAYEPASMAAIAAALPKGGVFVDIGAHCGMFTLFASSLVGAAGKVVAFEPSRREYERLIANVELNRLENVIPSLAAVGETEGEARLLIAEAGHSGHNTTSQRFTWDVRAADTVTAPVTTLDAFFLQHGIDHCDVIKTDIEGGTLQALKGAAGLLAKCRPMLVLELFERAMAANATTTAALVSWLTERGYVLHDLDAASGRLKPWVDEPEVSKNVVALPKR